MAKADDTIRAARLQKLVGKVSSSFGDKTIRVVVNRLVTHPKYGKFIGCSGKLAVHDPKNTAVVGDVVEIVPCRRMSKSKSWRLTRVIRHGKGEQVPIEG